jgi:CheY-like chemotaxis protein
MSKKLLLADDSVTIQRVIELTFSGEDIQVLAVGDGEAAIARIPVDKPDIVLADIGMPKRSGYDVCAFVKNHPDFKSIPVLLLAGAFEPVDEAKAKEVGCDGVLVKPFEPQHVIARVRELIGGATGSPTQSAVQDIPRPAARLAPPRPVELPTRADRTPIPDDLMDAAETELEPRIEMMEEPEDSQATSTIILDDSLDDYFDKLDEAFGNVSGPAPASTLATAGAPHAEARAPRPDRPVLERDLESFDEPTLIDDSASQFVDAPRVAHADPFAGMAELEPEDAITIPTLDDLLGSMDTAPEPAPVTLEEPPSLMTFEHPPAAMTFPSTALGAGETSPPMIFEAPPAPMIFDEPPAPHPVRPPAAVARIAPIAPVTPVAVVAPVAPQVPVSRAVAPVVSVSGRSIIADAFSALLAAEQGDSGASLVRLGGMGGNGGNASAAPVVTDAMVDDVARRVIEKLALGSSDQMSAVVRQIVSDVSERLVREEIERIRNSGQ